MTTLRNILTGVLLIACIILGNVLILQNAHIREQVARIVALKQGIDTALSANRQANTTITRLERSANTTAAVTSGWSAHIDALSAVGRITATAISEARNDNPQVPACLDGLVPGDISGSLGRLWDEACATSGGSASGCGLAATGLSAPGKAAAKAPCGGADVAKACPVGR